jgi:hypothetical protein
MHNIRVLERVTFNDDFLCNGRTDISLMFKGKLTNTFARKAKLDVKARRFICALRL